MPSAEALRLKANFYVVKHPDTLAVRFTEDLQLFRKLIDEEGWAFICTSKGPPKKASDF